jgi:hypothetical protein
MNSSIIRHQPTRQCRFQPIRMLISAVPPEPLPGAVSNPLDPARLMLITLTSIISKKTLTASLHHYSSLEYEAAFP